MSFNYTKKKNSKDLSRVLINVPLKEKKPNNNRIEINNYYRRSISTVFN